MKRLLVLLVVLLGVSWSAGGCGQSGSTSDAKKGLPPQGYEGMEKRMLMEKQSMMKQGGKAPAAETKK